MAFLFNRFTNASQKAVVEKNTSRAGRIRFLLALLAAVLSGAFLYTSYVFTFAPVKVVVAAKDFLPGETVTPEGLTLKTVPRGAIQQGAVTSIEALTGKTVGVHIFQGQQILSRMLAEAPGIDPKKTLFPLKDPVTPELSVGQHATVVAVLREGPLSLGEVQVFSVRSTSEGTIYLLSIPKDEAARMAYAVSSASKVYLFPNF